MDYHDGADRGLLSSDDRCDESLQQATVPKPTSRTAMSEEKYLFIGGPWDGRRESIPSFSMRAMTVIESSTVPYSVSKEHSYFMHRLRDHNKEHFVFVHGSHQEGIMQQLIDGYRKP